MDPETRRRGQTDTGGRRLLLLLLVSALLHLPITPLGALLGLLRFWAPREQVVDAPPINAIPVDLIDDFATAKPPPAATEPPEATGPAATAVALVPAAKPRVALRDAGVEAGSDAAADAALDAGRDSLSDASVVPLRDASPEHDQAALEASGDPKDSGVTRDAAPNDAAAPPITDPVVASDVRRVADPNANVRLMIYTARIRNQRLGSRVGQIMRSIAQWRDFLNPTDIDPIRDIDQIYIVASQLRDSSGMVAVLKHHEPARMRAALDALVRAQPDSGHWLDAGMPVAVAVADRAERRFLVPSPNIIIVTPPSAFAAARRLGKNFTLTPSPGLEALNVYLAAPWRAFLGLPIRIPHSIQWARIRVTPLADGGARADLEAADESEKLASEDALYLKMAVDAATQLDLGPLGLLLGQNKHRFIDKVSFWSEGTTIHGELSVSATQLATILDFAAAFVGEQSARRTRVDAGSSSR